ncbi:MAG: hypothetical protein J3K34DRAFT_489428 [Monoraphidium minutum]|nr:MAG: hypothetical protein J3K34DRAFT_489428 [Monoraphidium minutum]
MIWMIWVPHGVAVLKNRPRASFDFVGVPAVRPAMGFDERKEDGDHDDEKQSLELAAMAAMAAMAANALLAQHGRGQLLQAALHACAAGSGPLATPAGAAAFLREVLRREPDTTAVDGYGATALHAAVTDPRLHPLLPLLLMSGARASLSARDAAGRTPLALAAAVAAWPCVPPLLRAGPDQITDIHLWPTLAYMIGEDEEGHAAVAMISLMAALGYGRPPPVHPTGAAGGDACAGGDAGGRSGDSQLPLLMLRVAVLSGRWRAVRPLAECLGADVRAPLPPRGAGGAATTALHVACRRGDTAVAYALLAAGADPAQPDGRGRSALALSMAPRRPPMREREFEERAAAAAAEEQRRAVRARRGPAAAAAAGLARRLRARVKELAHGRAPWLLGLLARPALTARRDAGGPARGQQEKAERGAAMRYLLQRFSPPSETRAARAPDGVARDAAAVEAWRSNGGDEGWMCGGGGGGAAEEAWEWEPVVHSEEDLCRWRAACARQAAAAPAAAVLVAHAAHMEREATIALRREVQRLVARGARRCAEEGAAAAAVAAAAREGPGGGRVGMVATAAAGRLSRESVKPDYYGRRAAAGALTAPFAAAAALSKAPAAPAGGAA